MEILMLTFDVCISCVLKEIKYSYSCFELGRKIIKYIFLTKKLKDLPELELELNTENLLKYYKNTTELNIEKILIKQNYLNTIEFSKVINFEFEKDYILLGDFFMQLLIAFPANIFERDFNKLDGYYQKEPAHLVVNSDYLDEIKKNITIDPASLPMVCEPLKWSDTNFGEYLTNKTEKIKLILGAKTHGHFMHNKINLYNAINTMSSVKFMVNDMFLNYLENEGNYLLDISKDDFTASEELQRISILQIAKTYFNVSFYLPLRADWRGRIYTDPFFLDYQGGDLSLIQFEKGEVLTKIGLANLYIYGANVFNENSINKQPYS
jgi:hypothetical protein